MKKGCFYLQLLHSSFQVSVPPPLSFSKEGDIVEGVDISSSTPGATEGEKERKEDLPVGVDISSSTSGANEGEQERKEELPVATMKSPSATGSSFPCSILARSLSFFNLSNLCFCPSRSNASFDFCSSTPSALERFASELRQGASFYKRFLLSIRVANNSCVLLNVLNRLAKLLAFLFQKDEDPLVFLPSRPHWRQESILLLAD